MAAAAKLSAAPPMRMGELTVEPGLLALTGPVGATTVEPRVMQVLLVLLRAGERPVARDALAVSCWGPEGVSDDALNRAVAKLRRALGLVAGGGATVETIRHVGYRLRTTAARPAAVGPGEVAPALDLETRALGAMFEGTADGTAAAVRYLEQATEERPDVAPLWGSLAMAYVLRLPFVGDSRALTVACAREAARTAQRLWPGEGRSNAALVSLEPTYGAWRAKDAQLTAMLAVAPPGTAPLLFQRALYLASVGAMADALAILEPLAAAAPLVPWIQSARAHALAGVGRTAEALDAARRSSTRWPGDRLTWFTNLYIALAAGEVSAALRQTCPGDAPPAVAPTERALARQLAEALAAGGHTAALAAAHAHGAALDGTQARVEQAAAAAALLGLADEAISLLRKLYAEPLDPAPPSVMFPKIGFICPEERNTAILFTAPFASVRAHRDFPNLLERIGLRLG